MHLTGLARQLTHYIALAETGSFTKAAERCFLTQPALSRSIAMLEDELGVTLLDRIGKRSELTAVGRSVLEHARHVVYEAEELARCVELHTEGSAGRFRLGLSPTPSALLMGPLFNHVAKYHPTLRLMVSLGPVSTQVEALRERKLDALIVDMRSVTPTSDIHIEHVAYMKTGALCSRNHPLAKQNRTLSFEDLLDYPIAGTPVSDEVARLLINKFGPKAHPSEYLNLCCDDVPSLLDAVCNSHAVFLGVVAPGRDFINSGRLVQLDFPTDGLDTRYAIISLASRTVPPFFSHLDAFVRARLRD